MFEKAEILKILNDMIQEEIEVTIRAANSAHEAATHEELVAENKYDTKGLEASYLAGAQARRANELQVQLDELEKFQQRDLKKEDSIAIGSIVELENEDGEKSILFLVPSQGGYKVSYKGEVVQTITLNSPMGKALLGKVDGDEVELKKKDESIFYDLIRFS